MLAKTKRYTALLLLLAAMLPQLGPPPAGAVCEPLSTDKGHISQTVSVETAGKYTFWLRVLAPAEDQNSVFVKVDDQCPVVGADTKTDSDFVWVNNVGSNPLVVDLTSGQHTITVSGREAGTGVDKIMLVANETCVPTGTGANCANAVPASTSPAQEAAKAAAAADSLNLWIVGSCALAIAVAFASLVLQYLKFAKRLSVGELADDGVIVGGGLHPKSHVLIKLRRFVAHHKLMVMVCGSVIIVAVITGIVAATDGRSEFEAETASLGGGAKVVEQASASGGKYVVFEPNPPSDDGTTQPGGKPSGSSGGSSGGSSSGGGSNGGGGSSGSGGTSGGSGSGGGSSGGGGGASQTNCAPQPSQCGYPDSSNAGVPAGTSLSVLNLPDGYMDVTVAGTIIENKDVRGCIIVKATNVTIRNSKVSCDNYSVIYNTRDYYSAGGLLVENVDITCNNTSGTGMSEYGFTARRVEVYGCENAFSITDTVTIVDSYIHDLYEGSGGHADGIQMSGTPSSIVIEHSTILVPNTTAAVNWTGQTSSVRIENNLLGGGAYTVYCPRVAIPTGAYKVLNNRFADGMEAFGLTDSCAGGDVEFSGNYKDSDLSAVTPN